VLSVLRLAAGLFALAILPGCASSYAMFHPVGPVATSEFHFLLISTGVMMIIIVPTTVMTCLFAIRYRKSANAAYDPSFSHSLLLELAMWGVPLMIVLALAYCTYRSVFLVNPAAPEALGSPPAQNALGSGVKGAAGAPAPFEVDVITTDWQWIFVYPKQGIATIDDLVIPAGQNVQLQLTSVSVTNDIYIPGALPMIDVMPGMRTLDSFRVDKTAGMEGFSADFSGDGFSWMQFSTRIMSPADFANWVKQTQAAPDHLTYARFQQVARPTINEGAKPHYFSGVPADLFTTVYNATRAGVDYPVPEDVQTKAPFPSPTTGKQGDVKASS
jgi:cytochrome o ubiquinol oxidase subunit 2